MRDFILNEGRSARRETPAQARTPVLPFQAGPAVVNLAPMRAPVAKLRREPRTSFASLPRADRPAMLKRGTAVEDEEAPVKVYGIPGADKDPVGAFRKDPTLMPGDIVVLPDGPKVFKGGARLPHALAQFESLDRSRLVSKETRKTVAALTRTRGGTPAREAARHLPPKIATDVPSRAASAEAIRVVYPALIR